jgi:hypothetical protein
MPVVHVSAESFDADLDGLAQRLAVILIEQWERRVGDSLALPPATPQTVAALRVMLNMGVIEVGEGLVPHEIMREHARGCA